MFLLNINRMCIHALLFAALLSGPRILLAATDIKLEAPDGQWHQLSKYIGHGKWAVVNFWGTRCPPCQEEVPELVMFHDAHSNRDAIVIGIAIDFPSYGYANKKEVADFVDAYLVSFPVLLADATASENMGVGTLQGLPSTYMYNPQGKLVGYQVGGITKTIIEQFIKRYESQNK